MLWFLSLSPCISLWQADFSKTMKKRRRKEEEKNTKSHRLLNFPCFAIDTDASVRFQSHAPVLQVKEMRRENQA